MLNKKRKGFTLIEILLVIVILAALSATMMLSSRESTYFAKANSIISTMNLVRDAALSYYTNNIENNPTPREFYTKESQNYLGDTAKKDKSSSNFLDIDGIKFTVEGRKDGSVNDETSEIDSWYVKCDFSVLDSAEEVGVIKSLLEIDKEHSRLHKWNGTNYEIYDGGSSVWLRVK